MKYDKALEIAMRLKIGLSDGCERIEIVGSVKRHDKDEVHDIEILCIPDLRVPRPEFGQKKVFKTMLDKAIADLQLEDVLGNAKMNGEKYKKIPILGTDEINPFFLDLFIVKHLTWAIQNVIRTGPALFSHAFVTNKSVSFYDKGTNRRYRGLLPDQYLYMTGETKIRMKSENGVSDMFLYEEADAIALLGLGWIPPEKRREYISMTPVTS